MTWPLIALAIPSVLIGAMTFKHLLFGGGFGESIYFSTEKHEMIHEIGESVGSWLQLGGEFVMNPVFYLMLAGVITAYVLYIAKPHLPDVIAVKLRPII